MKRIVSNKLDIRILKLAKWEVPKSESIFAYSGESYLSIGYFDMLDVEPVNYHKKDGLHPLSAAYEKLHRVKGKNQKPLENYSIQELIVFSNVEEGGDGRKRIDDFWRKESLLMFVSLIHVDNESDIDKIINKIKEVFDESNYLWYFSFDYSGIIVFAKDMSVKQYLERMFRLNYAYEGQQKLIRDSYSLYGFSKKTLRKYYEQFERGKYELQEIENNETYSISVNIGIQNYNKYKAFWAELYKMEPNIQKYNLFGRHDVSIVNDKANLKWLLYVQYLIDKFTQADKEENKEEFLFSTHETFVKIAFDDKELKDSEMACSNEFYIFAREQLGQICEEFLDSIENNREIYNGEYKVPVQAVQHSILSILRNRYAEDFVLCMYQSFCEFLIYLTKQISKLKDDGEDENENASQFEICFDQYFQGLNALVNSAMHSERQFIQATSFNAIIYDVPAKIMAFYMAVIQKMQQIVRGEEDKKYTFLLTPSFHNEISVDVISYYPNRGEIAQDRILKVKINEKSLYNPRAVIRRMAHEIAHFVGDELRCRTLRKKFFKYSLIHVILRQILYKSFIKKEEYNDLVEEIYRALPKNSVFDNSKNNYSNTLGHLATEMPREFLQNQRIQEILSKHIKQVLAKCLGVQLEGEFEKQKEVREFIKIVVSQKRGGANHLVETLLEQNCCGERELALFTRVILEDINCELRYLLIDRNRISEMHKTDVSVISKIGEGALNSRTLREYTLELKSSYVESFADLQMTLLIGIDYLEYLTCFLEEENIDLDKLEDSISNISRISMVTFVLNAIGIWNIYDEKIASSSERIQEFHQKILRKVESLKKSADAEKLKKLFTDFQKQFGNFSNNSKSWGEESKADYKYDVMDLTNLQLVYYLTACASKSLEHYHEEKNKNAIVALQDTKNKVLSCDDIKMVFQTICHEVEKYKKYLQNENIK